MARFTGDGVHVRVRRCGHVCLDATTHKGGDAAARCQKVKRQSEILLQVADDEADKAKEDDKDLKEALTVVLPLEVHGYRLRRVRCAMRALR